jgi:hypothetical protein
VFYKDYVEALYENLGGQASITGKYIMHFFLWVHYVLVVC